MDQPDRNLSSQQMMERENFLNLSPAEVVQHLRQRPGGSGVCVFPFNGTRRWFMLEYGREFDESSDIAKNYAKIATQGYINTYKLVFEHGLDTIIAPVFGEETTNRGEEYIRDYILAGAGQLASAPAWLEFYDEYDIRIHFYGDYRQQLGDGQYSAQICSLFDEVTRKTAHHKKHRLFYGICADKPTDAIIGLAVEHYRETGQIASRQELIKRYYGEHIEKADIFIGFEKFTVYDYPMLNWGGESLYFTVAPSLYMTGRQLRNILYDYIYLRPMPDPDDSDYIAMPEADFEAMRQFFQINREATFGIGEMRGGNWYPKPGFTE